jgi:predicted outer membrane protein
MQRLGETAILALVVAAASGSVYGQSARGQAGSGGATSQQPTDAAQAGRSDSRTFISEMAIAGMAEVQLGKLATEKAANADVKAFGQMMVKDHSQANDELKQVASKLNVQLPAQLDEKHRDLAERLSKLQGAEFDREYINAMVEGHQEVAGKLRTRAGNQQTSNAPSTGNRAGSGGASGAAGTQTTGSSSAGANSQAVGTSGGNEEQALTQWAAKTLPAVQQHLERARELDQKLSK